MGESERGSERASERVSGRAGERASERASMTFNLSLSGRVCLLVPDARHNWDEGVYVHMRVGM